MPFTHPSSGKASSALRMTHSHSSTEPEPEEASLPAFPSPPPPPSLRSPSPHIPPGPHHPSPSGPLLHKRSRPQGLFTSCFHQKLPSPSYSSWHTTLTCAEIRLHPLVGQRGLVGMAALNSAPWPGALPLKRQLLLAGNCVPFIHCCVSGAQSSVWQGLPDWYLCLDDHSSPQLVPTSLSTQQPQDAVYNCLTSVTPSSIPPGFPTACRQNPTFDPHHQTWEGTGDQ